MNIKREHMKKGNYFYNRSNELIYQLKRIHINALKSEEYQFDVWIIDHLGNPDASINSKGWSFPTLQDHFDYLGDDASIKKIKIMHKLKKL